VARDVLPESGSGGDAAIEAIASEDLTVARRTVMLWTIFVILFAMWLLGMVTSYTMGGLLHILLILAVAAVLIRIIQGRRPV